MNKGYRIRSIGQVLLSAHAQKRVYGNAHAGICASRQVMNSAPVQNIIRANAQLGHHSERAERRSCVRAGQAGRDDTVVSGLSPELRAAGAGGAHRRPGSVRSTMRPSAGMASIGQVKIWADGDRFRDATHLMSIPRKGEELGGDSPIRREASRRLKPRTSRACRRGRQGAPMRSCRAHEPSKGQRRPIGRQGRGPIGCEGSPRSLPPSQFAVLRQAQSGVIVRVVSDKRHQAYPR